MNCWHCKTELICGGDHDMDGEALIKASVPITFMVLFLIIGLAPLYVMYGIIDRNIPVKTN